MGSGQRIASCSIVCWVGAVALFGGLASRSADAQPYELSANLATPHAFLQQRQNSCALGAVGYAVAILSGQRVSQRRLEAMLAPRYPNRDGRPPELGYSLSDMVFLFDALGIGSDAGRVSTAGLSRLTPPLVLRFVRPGLPHFVVLTEWEESGARIFDPGVGEMMIPKEVLLQRWQESGGSGLLVLPKNTG